MEIGMARERGTISKGVEKLLSLLLSLLMPLLLERGTSAKG